MSHYEQGSSSLLLFINFYFSNLISPIPPLLEPFHNIHQRNQNRHFDQRPYRTGQRLSATNTINGHDDRNRQFEIITRGREALRTRDFIAEAEAAAEDHGDSEDNGEVDDQGRADAEDGGDLRDDMTSLRSEEDDDGKDEADQRPRRDQSDEVKLVFTLPE